MSESLTLRKNFIFSFGEKVLRAALSFVSLGIVARYLGPEQYGVLSYLLALVSYFQLLGAFGLDQVLMRLFVSSPEKMDQTFWESVIVKTFFSFVSIILYLVFLFYNGEANTVSILFGISILSSVFDNSRILLETKNKHHIVAKIEICYQIFSALIKIFFSWLSFDVNLIFSIFVLDFFISKFIMIFNARNEVFPLKKMSINYERFKFYFKAGGFHCLSAIFVILNMKVDQLLVGKIMGMKELGNYSAAVRLSDAWYFLPMTVSSVFYPLALQKKEDKSNLYIQIVFDLILWISIFIIGIGLFFSDEIFHLLFGERFHINKHVIYLLFFSGLFVSVCVSTGVWLNVKGDRRVIFFRSMIGAIVNIVLNLILIRKYGLVGCGISSFVSYGLTFALTFIHKDSDECLIYLKKSIDITGVFKRFLKHIKSNN